MSVQSTIGAVRNRGSCGSGGFTLVEMMITIVVAGVLLAFGIPAFNDAVLGSKVSAVANDLYASIQLARSEAIKRNVPITLCPSTDAAACDDSGDWEVGWIVLNPATSEVLQVQEAAPEHFKVVQSGGTADLSFQPVGLGATAAVFTVCRASPVGAQERQIDVTGTGVAYVTMTENGSCP